MQNEGVKKNGFSGYQVTLIVVVSIIVAIGLTVWLFLSDVFATRFEPVSLDEQEKVQLQKKLNSIGVETDDLVTGQGTTGQIEPEPYTEVDADREITFSEKELNALLANNTDLAEKLAIDLSGDLISAKLLVPLDDEMPVLGGKTLKLTAGLGLSYANGKPVVILKGVSIWGVPVPSAYLGDIKNVDLVKEYGDQGFWKSFSDGLEGVSVKEGQLHIKLKP